MTDPVPDHMHAPIALMLETLEVECPVCGEAATAHRFMGIGECSGMRWLVFLPHLAPCRRVCAAGHVGTRKPGGVHTGPGTCQSCDHGHEDAPGGDLVLIDETGDLEEIQVDWGGDDDGGKLDGLLER